MSSEVIMVVGPQASGKTTVTQPLRAQGYMHVSRDVSGGKISDLLHPFEGFLKDGANIVLDNTFPKATARKPFIELAKRYKATIRCVIMATPIEECQINALRRMWQRYGQVFYTANDIKEHPKAKNDPNIFPVVVLFRYKKEYEKPTTDEGFDRIETQKFVRLPWGDGYSNKALLLDYDSTLRETKSGAKWPTNTVDIEIMPNRTPVLQRYVKDGYLLLGVSNQSAIAKRQFTIEEAQAMFDHTNKLLGVQVTEVAFCPHGVPPSCYCRKPQSGMGVHLIERHQLDPNQCIMVGDATTDKTFAKRLGIQYADQGDFFA